MYSVIAVYSNCSGVSFYYKAHSELLSGSVHNKCCQRHAVHWGHHSVAKCSGSIMGFIVFCERVCIYIVVWGCWVLWCLYRWVNEIVAVRKTFNYLAGGSLFLGGEWKSFDDVMWLVAPYDGTSRFREKLHCSWMFWNVKGEETSDGSLMLAHHYRCLVGVVVVTSRRAESDYVSDCCNDWEMFMLICGLVYMVTFCPRNYATEYAFGIAWQNWQCNWMKPAMLRMHSHSHDRGSEYLVLH